MTEPVSPTGPADDRRAGRRNTDPLLAEKSVEPAVRSNLPVPVTAPAPKAAPAASFDAQLMGQDGQKRGLRGGQPVLDHARSAYLGAEYSGKGDRRPPKGAFSKTEI